MIKIKTKTIARQSIVDRKAPIGDGICHEKTAKVFPTIPHDIQRYVAIALNTEVKMKGKKNIGFNISGVPKINGSEIPKKEGIKPIFPTVLNCLDLERIIKKAKASTEPDPPIMTKYVLNGVVKILLKSLPAIFSAAFIDRFPSLIGPRIPAKAAS